jgi:hypothetical protein
MKTLNTYIFLIMCFYSYSALGSITTLFGTEDPPFVIGVVGGSLPTTTNGEVAEFTITNSSWTVVSWYINTDRCVNTNSQGGTQGANLTSHYLYVVFKNIKANKEPHNITCQAKRFGDFYWAGYTVPGLTLVMPIPTFPSGSSLNIPCYITTAQINLNDYKNVTGLSAGLEITDEFEWTLPSGWQTTSSQTGTFVAGKTINIILPFSGTSGNINVRAKAYDQYSASATLQVTRNLENFLIGGSDAVTCYSTNTYTAPVTAPGVTYTWQLPSGWTGVANGNSINATATGSSGTITCTMTSCGLSKPSTKTVTVNVVAPGTIIAGPGIVCSSGSQFSVNIPTGSTISWNPGPGITRVSPQGFNPCEFSSTGSASSWIDATVNGSCGSIPLPRKTVWAGIPNTPTEIIPFLNNGMEFGNDSYYEFHLNPQQGATSYNWVVGGGVITDGQGTNWITVKTNKITGQSNINFAVSVRAENCSGPSNYFVRTGWVIPGTGGATLVFNPNPATEETTLSIESDSDEKTFDDSAGWELEIYDNMQKLKLKNVKVNGKEYKINTSGWKEGIYLARVKYKDEILTGKLVIQ